MPTFEVQHPTTGQTYEVDAPDVESATSNFRDWVEQQAGAIPLETASSLARQNFPILGKLEPQSPETERLKQQHPEINTWTKATGGTIGYLPAAGMGMIGGTALAGGIGAADALAGAAAGRGKLSDVPQEAAIQAGSNIVGGALGSLAGKSLSGIVNWLVKPGGALAGVSHDVAETAARAAVESGLTPEQVAQKATELGPQGFAGEYGQRLKGHISSLGATPSPGQTAVRSAFETRNAGANARIGQTVEQNLGPFQSAQGIERELERQRETVSAQYGPQLAQTGRPVNLDPMRQVIQQALPQTAGPHARALEKTLDMIAPQYGAEGGPARFNMRRPAGAVDPQKALAIRGILDDEIQATGDQPALNRLHAVSRQLLDNAISQSNPEIKALDTTLYGLHRSSEGLAAGGQVLGAGKSTQAPGDFASDFATLTSGGVPLRAGVRSDIERMVGTKANDVQALLSALQGEGGWNAAKLSTVFGEEPTQNVIRDVTREKTFKDNYSRLIANSETAARQAGQKETEKVGAGVWGKLGNVVNALSHFYEPHIMPLQFLEHSGLPAELGAREASSIAKAKGQLGNLLTTQGPQAADVINALLNYQRPGAAVGLRAQQAARALALGGGNVAAGSIR